MAKVEYWECDGCGKRKGPDNHWFAATANNATTCGPVWVVYLLANAPAHGIKAYCGEQCLHKALSDWVGEQPARAKQAEAYPEPLVAGKPQIAKNAA